MSCIPIHLQDYYSDCEDYKDAKLEYSRLEYRDDYELEKEEKMSKLEPDSINPKCECGSHLETVARWNEWKGVYWTFNCRNCGWEWDEDRIEKEESDG